jgi:hypothetical protein
VMVWTKLDWLRRQTFVYRAMKFRGDQFSTRCPGT